MVQRQFPSPPSCSSSCSSRSPSSTAQAASPEGGTHDLRPARRSRSAARRRRRSTTPTARPRRSCRSSARVRRSRTSNSTRILRDVSTSTPRPTILGGPRALPFGIAPDRLHPAHADRGRDRRSRRGRCRRHPVHALDARHHVDRGREGGEPGRPQLVPAVRHARTRDLLRARPARRGSRIRHAALHRRHPDRGRPAARQAQRILDPAAADARHDHQRDPAAVVVVRLPHDSEARVRVAVVDRRHRRRAARRRDGSDDQRSTISPIIRDIWPGKIVVKGVQNVEDSGG